MQDYIPAGNGDASGEYGTSNGTNKNFTASDKKSSKANVITENKSVVVENKGKKLTPREKIKKAIETEDIDESNKLMDEATSELKFNNDKERDEFLDIVATYSDPQEMFDYLDKVEKKKKANIINDDLTGKKDNYNKALDDLKQWETYYDDDMDVRTSKADARDKYIKNSDYVNEDTKLQNEYVFESMKGKDVNKIYDLIKETGVDPKSIYEKGKYPDAEFLVREKILKLIKDGKVKIDYSKKKIPTYGGRDVSNMVVGTLMENMRYELAYGNKFKNK